MKRILGLGLGLGLSLSAHAVQLSFDAPTTRADGSPLAANEIAGYKLYCENKISDIPATAPQGIYELEKAEVLPGYGTFSCHLTTIDTLGLESAESETVSIEWIPAAPMAPTNLIILQE